jgi:hypothetical protein
MGYGWVAANLLQFANLTALRLWNITNNVENALPDIVARSPGLQHLFVHLISPDPDLVLYLLKFVPALRSLRVCRWVDEECYLRPGEGGRPDERTVKAVREAAKELCPTLQVCDLGL